MPQYRLKIENEEFTIYSPETPSGNDGVFRLCAGSKSGQVIGAYSGVKEAALAFAGADTENSNWNTRIEALKGRPLDISGWHTD